MEWLDHLLHLHTKQTELLEGLMATAADLKTAIDNLTAAVAKVQAEITALKNAPAPLIDQPTLDADTAAVQAQADALNAL
jgi:hypothetical protein